MDGMLKVKDLGQGRGSSFCQSVGVPFLFCVNE